MVDAVISFVLERLGDYLVQEANFLLGVKDEVESLKKELEWMNCFVKDAEAKQAGNHLIRQWVSDIRDIAYDAEDVLDKFILSVHDADDGTSMIENRVVVDEEDTSNRRQGFFASIKSCSCLFGEGSNRKESNLITKAKGKVGMHNIGKEIEALKKRLDDVSRRCQLYGLQNIISNPTELEIHDLDRLRHIRRAPSFAVDEIHVGFEDDTKVLLAKLFDEEPRRSVVSIYGMGGLGKTTLARNLYNNNDVKNKFAYCAWVSVSQDYKLKNLLVRIIESFNFKNARKDLENMTEDDLERSIHRSLLKQSYLIVLDDIWDKDDWVSLKRAFPKNNKGSRVIITTRIKGVAERSDDCTYVHALRFLRQDESWQLFCEKAFRNSNSAEQGSEELGREMVQKCRGLPIAIVVLGGLLATKKPQDWRLVRDHLWRDLRSDSIEISHLLDLSFNDMPYQLKLCFLYLGLFPEDYEINAKKLIRLLVAEDFVPQREDQIMEERVKDNLDELINRSLIQVEKKCWGRVATFRVHDLLRDLAIQKAKEVNFIHICDEIKNPNHSSVVSSCRRQAIYSSTPNCLWLCHGNPLSRSLLLFNQQLSYAPYIEDDAITKGFLFKRFRLLRVFDVQHKTFIHTRVVTNYRLSERIRKLIHLKYLGFRGSEISNLPSSIVNLKKLQTLDLSSGTFEPVELPKEINMMHELRHLLGDFTGTLSIENLSNLQTLKYVQAESWNKVNPSKLVSLRELHIEEDSETTRIEEFSFQSIAKLRNLQFLSVRLLDSSPFDSVEPLSCCQYLQDLRLNGRTVKLPEGTHVFLKNLECLLLSVSHPKEDPMPALEMLPQLTILDLHIRGHSLKKLRCSAKGFPRLEILQIDTDEIDEWEVEEGALPRLRGLNTPEIPMLKIPERLRSLPQPAEWECPESRYDF